MEKIKICVAGATGWAGSELCRGIVGTADMELVAAISRNHAGKKLGEAIGIEGLKRLCREKQASQSRSLH